MMFGECDLKQAHLCWSWNNIPINQIWWTSL